MNQDAVKKLLLSIEDAPFDFSLIFSGKKSRKVNGLYKPDGREIIIHNRNFTDGKDGTVNENSLVYTAIHEYAHHLHACKHGGKLSARAHTQEFWAIFHALLEKAEGRGLYSNKLDASPALSELTARIKYDFLAENGRLLKELGRRLVEAQELCSGIGLRFEDYVDRILCMPRASAKLAVKMFQYDIKPEIGPDNMRFVAGIRNEEARFEAERAFLAGKSPDTVKINHKTANFPAEDGKLRLVKEKQRIERTIDALTKRLDEVERELENL
ncbi:MAG: hypothetical protein LBO04_08025 [Spirochaetaceae bacterium]|jgi:hypothetical protein|nr:hypothetical protein [Spirochaetaceae bacterium]